MPGSSVDRCGEGFFLLLDPASDQFGALVASLKVTQLREAGDPRRRPPNFEAQLADAYARLGVPRPSIV